MVDVRAEMFENLKRTTEGWYNEMVVVVGVDSVFDCGSGCGN